MTLTKEQIEWAVSDCERKKINFSEQTGLNEGVDKEYWRHELNMEDIKLQAIKFTKAMMEPSGLMVSEAYLIHEKESENNTKTHQWPMICALKAATEAAWEEVSDER
jgi:hypothetical protein